MPFLFSHIPPQKWVVIPLPNLNNKTKIICRKKQAHKNTLKKVENWSIKNWNSWYTNIYCIVTCLEILVFSVHLIKQRHQTSISTLRLYLGLLAPEQSSGHEMEVKRDILIFLFPTSLINTIKSFHAVIFLVDFSPLPVRP